jgi:DNA-binding transcriptional LysR family regulator
VSKRLSQMETRIGVALINRTTRRMSLTPEGEVFLEHARRILGDIDDLDQLLTKSKGTPKGLLKVNATLGFGRMHVAPVISRYVARYPEVDVQLQLSASPPALTGDEFDVLDSGRLVQVLPQYHTPDADIYAVYCHCGTGSDDRQIDSEDARRA